MKNNNTRSLIAVLFLIGVGALSYHSDSYIIKALTAIVWISLIVISYRYFKKNRK